MTREQAAQALTIMSAAWPGFATDDVTVRLWLQHLEQADLDTARLAVDDLITTRTRPPSIADWHTTANQARVRAHPQPQIERAAFEPTAYGRQALAEIKQLARRLTAH